MIILPDDKKPPLKEFVHSSGEFWSCGVAGCVKTFSTAVPYSYHLNSAHDYNISNESRFAVFKAALDKRLDKAMRKRVKKRFHS